MNKRELYWTGEEHYRLNELKNIDNLVVYASSDVDCLASFFRFLTMLKRSNSQAIIVLDDELKEVAEMTGFNL